jgi:type IV secretory pathway VirB2 component (pilin)
MKKPLLLLSALIGLLLPTVAKAVEVINTDTIPETVKGGPGVNQLITNIVNILIYTAGIASVIVIIVGGIMYIVSGGNETSTKRAKDAILYAIIGLVISLGAFAIVNFVLGGIGG